MVIIMLVLTSDIAISQIRTYNGVFETGTATYQYRETPDLDRIFEGNFLYKGNIVDLHGSFKNNTKTGKWSYVAKNKKLISYKGDVIFNININGEYDSLGQLNGKWEYSISKKFPGVNQADDKETSTARFENGVFVGKIVYKHNWPNDVNIEGYYDKNGLMDSVWTNKTKTIVTTEKFHNGIFYYQLKRNITNGEKSENFDMSDIISEYFVNYDSSKHYSKINN